MTNKTHKSYDDENPEHALERLNLAVTRVEQHFQRIFEKIEAMKADQGKRQEMIRLTEEASKTLDQAMQEVRDALKESK